jgi:predicted ArsR family transcriptional regulator
MHSTKSEILALLKRTDGATVDELASSLGLAPMTVRQHLTALERDALVEAEEVRRRTGRPHYAYRLTGEGHRTMAQGCDRMLALLVEEAGLLDAGRRAASPEERRRALFRSAAQRLAERHRPAVASLGGAEQADRVAEILRSYGGFAEWHETGGGLEFRDYGCVFRNSVGCGGACDWHETFLSAIFEGQVQAAPKPDGCAECCSYSVNIRVPVPVEPGVRP